jgi:integrase
MGTIAKTDQGRYTVRWRDPDGRQREKTFRLKGDASDFSSQVEADKSRGTYRDPDAGRITFKQYAERWMAAQPHSATTAETYTRHLRNHINPVLGSRRLDGLRPTDVQGWVTGLSKSERLAPSTIGLLYRIFASILRGAVLDDRISRSPCQRIKLPHVSRTTVRLLTVQQVEALAGAIDARYRAMVVLAAGAGLRQGEAFGICLPNLHFLDRQIAVETQVKIINNRQVLSNTLKTPASRRVVPLADAVARELSAHLARYAPHPESQALFVAPRGGYLKRSTFNEQIWRKGVTAAKLPADTTFHDLRHTFASLLIEQGVQLTELSRWMGHKSITETADTYGHLYPAAESRARDAIDAAFSAGPATTPNFQLMLT